MQTIDNVTLYWSMNIVYQSKPDTLIQSTTEYHFCLMDDQTDTDAIDRRAHHVELCVRRAAWINIQI